MAAGDLLTGVRDTSTILGNKQIIDMSNKIAYLEPDEAPLTTFLQQLSREACHAAKFEWLEEEGLQRKSLIATVLGSGDTSVNVTTGEGVLFKVGDLVVVTSTLETLMVTAVATDAVSITRSWGAVAAAAAAVGDELFIIGNASAESAASPTKKSMNPAAKFNYCQNIRTPFGLSDIAANTSMYGGADKNSLRRAQMIEHKKNIERVFLYGEKAISGTTRSSGGLREFISTNVYDVGGFASHAELESYMQYVFAYGSDRRLGMASPMWLSALSLMGADKLRAVPRDNLWGFGKRVYLSSRNNIFCKKYSVEWGSFWRLLIPFRYEH